MGSLLYNVFTLTGIMAGLETFALTLLTMYSRQSSPVYLIGAIVAYGGLIPYTILKTLDFEGIGTVNFLWNIITTVSMVLVSYYYFNDTVSNLHIISLMLGVASIVLINVANSK